MPKNLKIILIKGDHNFVSQWQKPCKIETNIWFTVPKNLWDCGISHVCTHLFDFRGRFSIQDQFLWKLWLVVLFSAEPTFSNINKLKYLEAFENLQFKTLFIGQIHGYVSWVFWFIAYFGLAYFGIGNFGLAYFGIAYFGFEYFGIAYSVLPCLHLSSWLIEKN